MFWCEKNEACDPVPPEVLKNILGSAYNSRYMSIRQPKAAEVHSEEDSEMKRSHESLSFYVNENFSVELDRGKPAWEVNHTDIEHSKHVRLKRKADNSPYRQWNCLSKIAWTDLGPGYFPRYLRSVECSGKPCWYGRYLCKPRSFTVKILKRQDKCVSAQPMYVDRYNKMERLHNDLKELWVWEERAINFCCYCSA